MGVSPVFLGSSVWLVFWALWMFRRIKNKPGSLRDSDENSRRFAWALLLTGVVFGLVGVVSLLRGR